MILVPWLLAFAAGVAMTVRGAEAFAEHLGWASLRRRAATVLTRSNREEGLAAPGSSP